VLKHASERGGRTNQVLGLMRFQSHRRIQVTLPKLREEQVEVDLALAYREVGVALAGIVVQVQVLEKWSHGVEPFGDCYL